MSESRRILTIDIGNTAMKVGVYHGERLVHSVVCSQSDAEPVRSMLTLNSVDGVSYCCVGKDMAGIYEELCDESDIVPLVALTAETPLPIEVEYDRDLLGVDRVAAAVGALSDLPTLVVDAGTAVTTDLVADGKFLGGNISPGLKLRFRSLNEYTSRLPLVDPCGSLPQLGNDTVTAIRAGVIHGLVAEIADIYNKLRINYKNVKMILTGGDADFLAPLLQARGVDLIVDHATVGRGLVRIFNYNYDE